MLDQPETDELRARIAEVEARRVPFGEVVRWFGPWILGGLLVLVCVAGLWCASSAADAATYAIGWTAAVLALLALAWEIRALLEGGLGSVSLLVDEAESLVVLMALLLAMAVGGLILAARGGSPAASGAGYGLCIFGIVFGFANLKHYFDRLEG
jgi:hypothetical protein